MEPRLREAKPDEAPLLRDFQVAMALESEGLRLDPEICLRGVRQVFADPSIGSYFVLEVDSASPAGRTSIEIAACVLVQREWSDWRARTVLWIHSLYVRPEFRRQGLYRRIYASLQDRVQNDASLGGLRLYVDQTNAVGIQAYEKLGMTREHYHLYEWMKPAPRV